MSGLDHYLAIRHAETERKLLARARRFMARYDPSQPTVLLVPGSMGSQLDRSIEPYYAIDRSRAPEYDAVWLDPGVLFGDIHHLAIDAEGMDQGGHVVVPNGALRFLFTPYDRTWAFCRERGVNFLVFSYDWRRPADEAAVFLDTFVERVAHLAIRKFGPGGDPRPRMTIACHSMGGLVGLLWLQRLHARAGTDVAMQSMHRMVTVGTPFYGTASPLRYSYEGVPFLNRLYGADTVTRIIGSFPGPSLLHFLDRHTFDEYGEAFRSRGEVPELSRYPCRESGDPDASEIDPYGKLARQRFPRWTVTSHLDAALANRRAMHRALPAQLLGRLFHVRAIRHQTCSEIGWRCIDAERIRPADTAPFDRIDGVGDGIVPQWSARYCFTPAERVLDIDTDTSHDYLMEDDAVLDAIATLVETGSLPRSAAASCVQARQRPASPAQLERFSDELVQGTVKRNDPRLRNRSIWQRIILELGFD